MTEERDAQTREKGGSVALPDPVKAVSDWLDANQANFIDWETGAFDADECARVAIATLRHAVAVEQRMEAMGMRLVPGDLGLRRGPGLPVRYERCWVEATDAR